MLGVFNQSNENKIGVIDLLDAIQPDNFMRGMDKITHFFRNCNINSFLSPPQNLINLDVRFPFLVDTLPEAEGDKEIYFIAIAEICNDLNQLFQRPQLTNGHGF